METATIQWSQRSGKLNQLFFDIFEGRKIAAVSKAEKSMPLDEQSMLVELINKHIIEKHRVELVAEVQE